MSHYAKVRELVPLNKNTLYVSAASLAVIIVLGLLLSWPFIGGLNTNAKARIAVKHSNLAVTTPADKRTTVAQNIKVDCSGAVNRPGVVILASGDRIVDALVAVGGG